MQRLQFAQKFYYTPQSIVHAQRMATSFKFFMKQSLPTSNETELPDAATKEINSAVKKVLEERNGVSGRKRRYTHFTPEARAKIVKYAAQCGNTAAVKHFCLGLSKSRREYSALVQEAISNRFEEVWI